MKRLKELLLLFLVGGAILFTSGCGKSKKQIIEESLKDVYKEEFIVHEIKTYPNGFDATVSPTDKPECLFNARIKSDGTFVYDDYYKRFVDYSLKKKLQEDLKQFFPNSCLYVDSNTVQIDDGIDFRSCSLKELIDNMQDEEGYNKEAMVRIFVSKKIGTKEDYEGEYNYFNDTDKLDNHESIPMTVCIYYVDDDIKNEIEMYFRHDLDLDNYFVEQVVQSNSTDFWDLGVATNESKEVGCPPKIGACFIKSMPLYIDSLDEYIRRRELLENGKIQ